MMSKLENHPKKHPETSKKYTRSEISQFLVIHLRVQILELPWSRRSLDPRLGRDRSAPRRVCAPAAPAAPPARVVPCHSHGGGQGEMARKQGPWRPWPEKSESLVLLDLS
jgi:hypothetical protein